MRRGFRGLSLAPLQATQRRFLFSIWLSLRCTRHGQVMSIAGERGELSFPRRQSKARASYSHQGVKTSKKFA